MAVSTRNINYMDSMDSMVTTISISEDTKEKLKNLGRAGDSYDAVINKMYEAIRKNLLMTYLYDESDTVTIDEAVAEAKRWRKSS
jgi:predicted CopG family antitoxin